ncbi:MAG: sulfide/dihydroorotate dehydrogenase-like FAD/NAD-binding protein [Acidimicrobiia bacterium]
MDGRFRLCEASTVGPDIVRLVVDAPRVATHARPGQFVVVRATERSERIPLTISDHDATSGRIVLVVQNVGSSTAELCALPTGVSLADVLGPLGTPTEIEDFGHCVVVAGGVGIAIALPVMRGLQAGDNQVTGVFGARTAEHLILLDEVRRTSDLTLVTTEDGSAGRKGLVTDALAEVISLNKVDRVFVAGPIGMMQAVAEATRHHAIPTIASLNPIMVDGTGMCGGCRVAIGGDTRFACVDGPEFDAHLVDFDMLLRRNQAYTAFEACQVDIARVRSG